MEGRHGEEKEFRGEVLTLEVYGSNTPLFGWTRTS
jgi:hypothetical protein